MARSRPTRGSVLVGWPRSSRMCPVRVERSAESLLAAMPPEHIAFLRSCREYHETDTHLLLHANYDPARPLAEQDPATIRWRSLRDSVPAAHYSGKTAVLGHTPTKSGEILDLGYLKGIDTGCCYGGWLTVLDLVSGETWQADRLGQARG